MFGFVYKLFRIKVDLPLTLCWVWQASRLTCLIGVRLLILGFLNIVYLFAGPNKWLWGEHTVADLLISRIRRNYSMSNFDYNL